MYLVEADNDKNPSAELYGDESDVLSSKGGLIPQYLRMSLAMIDLVQPYIVSQYLAVDNGIKVT